MLDSQIIEEALREHNEGITLRKEEGSKSAKQVLFEHLLAEMYPMSLGYAEQKQTKYTRMADLISLLQQSLWKIDDACRAKEKNPQDSDIYDSIKSQYETVVENILDRIKDVWAGPEEYESDDQSQPNQSQDSSIDWEQVAAELQPEEVITSPQNKQYVVVEVNNPKVKVKESKTGEIFIVDIENALKWKHA